eukprot:gnl/TRDRNA2_/TRDRNA2_167143_c0_seq3.p1 gnl/TRDRNA2_/TRDRNA2_167143_c0~~gnl/TRDRNA2_/TRDRNA2_167143_c0_seq3.p1  ORF type:complete len:241 (+),score=29.73 gnl/TRDRNA2_/TRDRNA2_167143_c0_seq3:112-834(+)
MLHQGMLKPDLIVDAEAKPECHRLIDEAVNLGRGNASVQQHVQWLDGALHYRGELATGYHITIMTAMVYMELLKASRIVAIAYLLYKFVPEEHLLWIEEIVADKSLQDEGLQEVLLHWAATRAEAEHFHAARQRKSGELEFLYCSSNTKGSSCVPVACLRPGKWQVVGGVGRGILIRTGPDLKSPELAERLSHGAFVQEVSRKEDRLLFRKLSGRGPECGWASIVSRGKILLARVGDSSS